MAIVHSTKSFSIHRTSLGELCVQDKDRRAGHQTRFFRTSDIASPPMLRRPPAPCSGFDLVLRCPIISPQSDAWLLLRHQRASAFAYPDIHHQSESESSVVQGHLSGINQPLRSRPKRRPSNPAGLCGLPSHSRTASHRLDLRFHRASQSDATLVSVAS